jgi:hypothetical protein
VTPPGSTLKSILLLPLRPFIWLVRFLWLSITGLFQGQYLFASARLFLALFSAFLLIGIPVYGAGLIFGFDGLALIDRGLERHSGLIAAIGDALFRIACGIVLIICALGVYIVVRDQTAVWHGKAAGVRSPETPAGLGCLMLAIIIGYFAWVGAVYAT